MYLYKYFIAGLIISFATWCGEFDFHPEHDCFENNSNSCNHLRHMSTIDVSLDSDIISVPHRGLWGSYSANYAPENSMASFNEAHIHGFNIIESDFMLTLDNEVIASHDYDLTRTSGVTMNKVVVEMTLEEIQKLRIVSRDGEKSDQLFLTLEEVLEFAKLTSSVIAVDIKGMTPKVNEGVCIAYCEYMGKVHQVWFELLAIIVDKIILEGSTENVVIKTNYTPEQMIYGGSIDDDEFVGIGEEKFNKILWVPRVGAPSQDISGLTYVLNFISDWDYYYANYSLMEVRYKTGDDVLLQEFDWQEDNYLNVLEFLSKVSNKRSGIFAIEPMGRKGAATRYGDWAFVDTSKDFRANFLRLKYIPGFQYSVITADNPMAWRELFKYK